MRMYSLYLGAVFAIKIENMLNEENEGFKREKVCTFHRIRIKMCICSTIIPRIAENNSEIYVDCIFLEPIAIPM